MARRSSGSDSTGAGHFGVYQRVDVEGNPVGDPVTAYRVEDRVRFEFDGYRKVGDPTSTPTDDGGNEPANQG